MSTGFFITGTDTEIGKTYATCCLADTIKSTCPHLEIFPRKPIASGAIHQNGILISEDAQQLKAASQSPQPLDTICRYRFEQPISPQRAIKQSQCSITIEDLVSASATPNKGVTLVEGAGGFYSPLALDGLNKDLAVALDYPVILVVGNKLGCINQTLLNIEAIAQHQLQLAAVIISDVDADADQDNVQDIKERIEVPVIHLPFAPNQAWQKIERLENFFKL